MRKNNKHYSLMQTAFLTVAAFVALLTIAGSCTTDIDLGYRDIEPIIMVQGVVTNEKTEVLITQTRSMYDSVKGRCLPGAQVVVSSDHGERDILVYDEKANVYRSTTGFTGTPGHTYFLSIDYKGQHFEGKSKMHLPSPVKSSGFTWFPVAGEKVLMYQILAEDPYSDIFQYYWCRVAVNDTVYRWDVRTNRGNFPGEIAIDIICMTKRQAEKNDKGFSKRLLYDGDIVTLDIMPVDSGVSNYLMTQLFSEMAGVTAKSNLTGGCIGVCSAMSVSHGDTIKFCLDSIK
jgi:hypothetical protein